MSSWSLHYGKHVEGRRPSDVLRAVREALGSTAASVRRNGQAVTLRFQSWPNVDVVPAVACRADKSAKKPSYYEIPDMHSESWIRTRPHLHSRDVHDAVISAGPGFRRVVKMVKWWNHPHGAPMQSFHIEVIALKAVTDAADITWALFRWFKVARDTIGARLRHGDAYVDDYLSTSARSKLSTLLTTTASQARSAWHATYDGNTRHAEAIRMWGQILGAKFPRHG